RYSTSIGPLRESHAVGSCAALRPVLAVTSMTCQSRAGDDQNVSNSSCGPRAARCSTIIGPFGVCQLTGAPAILRPDLAVTSTACQSCAGDHQNTMIRPSGDRP